MSEIEQLLFRFDPADRVTAQVGEPGVRGLQRAVAREIAQIVGQLDGHHSVLLHRRQAIEIGSDHAGVLRSDENAELLLALGLKDVGSASNEEEPIRIGTENALPGRNLPLVVSPRIGAVADRKNSVADDRNSGSDRFRPGPIAPPQLVVGGIGIARAAERVDDDGAIVPARTHCRLGVYD